MHGVGVGFYPLGELVQGDGYGRRPPGRSPGRAPQRGAPRCGAAGACGRPPAPCTGCKKGKRPRAPAMLPALSLPGPLRPAQAVKRENDPAPSPCCPPCPLPCPAAGVCAAGWGRAFALWESWCRGMDTAAGCPGEARAGRPSGAPPAAEQRGPAADPLRPAQVVKRESVPAPPRKSTCPIYR